MTQFIINTLASSRLFVFFLVFGGHFLIIFISILSKPSHQFTLMDNQKINLMFIPQIEITKAQDLTKITEAKFKPIPSETKTKTKTKSVKKKKTMKNLPEETKKDNDMEESIEIQDSVLINNDPRSKLVESFEDVKTPPNNYPQTKDFSMKLIKTRARIGSDLTQCKPNYPRVSKRRGEQGTVILRFLINEKGRAEKAEIKQTSGYTRLDNAAKAGLFSCKFIPASENGVFIKDWAVIPYVFQLK